MNSLFHLAASVFVLNIYIQILSMRFCMKNIIFIKNSCINRPNYFFPMNLKMKNYNLLQRVNWQSYWILL